MTFQPMQKTTLELLLKNMDNKEFSDFEFHARDGVIVPGIKLVFAMRSKFLQCALQGEFMEAKTSVVKTDFDAAVMEMIRDFCYFDKILQKRLATNETVSRTLLQVIFAADYYGIDGLEGYAMEQLRSIVNSKPCLACAILDEAGTDVPGSRFRGVPSLVSFARFVIATRVVEALLPSDDSCGGGIKCISRSEDVKAILLHRPIFNVTQFQLFQCLDAWATCKYGKSDSGMAARELLSDCIVLSKIDTIVLSSRVSQSTWIEPGVIFSAITEALKSRKYRSVRSSRVSRSKWVVPQVNVFAVEGQLKSRSSDRHDRRSANRRPGSRRPQGQEETSAFEFSFPENVINLQVGAAEYYLKK